MLLNVRLKKVKYFVITRLNRKILPCGDFKFAAFNVVGFFQVPNLNIHQHYCIE